MTVFCKTPVGIKGLVLPFSMILLTLTPPLAQAGFYLDLDLFTGYTGATVAAGATAPTLVQSGAGSTLGITIGPLLLGATSDYRWINQYSSPSSNVGNLRGTRWNMVSPTVGLVAGNFLLKGDVQFLGNYQFGQPGSDGGTIACTNPIGFRLLAAYQIIPHGYLGLFYETVSFSTETDSAATPSSSSLSPAFQVWQAGLSVSFVPLK